MLCRRLFLIRHESHHITKKFFQTVTSLDFLTAAPLDRHVCLISRSRDIFTNLALEDVLYRTLTFKEGQGKLLLLWRDKSCVVIGRHQNPWSEVFMRQCRNLSIPIARRNSG